MIVVDRKTIRFETTGRNIYCFGPAIGLMVDGSLPRWAGYGWDGDLGELEDEKLTSEERQELGAFMIEKWMEFWRQAITDIATGWPNTGRR